MFITAGLKSVFFIGTRLSNLYPYRREKIKSCSRGGGTREERGGRKKTDRRHSAALQYQAQKPS